MTRELEKTFRALFDNQYSYVRRTLVRLGVHEGDADDLAQEVFLRVHGRISDFDSAGPSRPWLFSFAVRIASNYRQSARVKRETPQGDPGEKTPARRGDPEEQVQARELQDRVIEALRMLKEDRRAIFVMHELDQLPAPQIAAALDLPVNTVYSRLRVAREDFRKAYKQLTLRSKP